MTFRFARSAGSLGEKQVILAPPLSSVGFLVAWMTVLTWGN
jgi:hypothetical protein